MSENYKLTIMKELSIEEKAKRYDEAIERAKKWRNAPNVDKIPTFGNRVIEEIFPELRESEDERIRKELIELIGCMHDADPRKKGWLAWLEKKELKKIEDEDPQKVSNKFDITTLQPFDKVLIRDYETFKWGVGLFAYYKEGANRPFGCNSATWEQCVPYNDDTKHLIGTTDDAPDFYKTWEL